MPFPESFDFGPWCATWWIGADSDSLYDMARVILCSWLPGSAIHIERYKEEHDA